MFVRQNKKCSSCFLILCTVEASLKWSNGIRNAALKYYKTLQGNSILKHFHGYIFKQILHYIREKNEIEFTEEYNT